jgi:Sec-independent protein translocase protein TatA
MPKKSALDKRYVTQDQLKEVVDTIREVGDTIMEALLEFKKEMSDFKLQQDLNWKEQKQFNKEIAQKVDMNTASLQALDKRVRYQDDMPERLDHVENQQYELTRRVTALEKR